MNKYYPLKMGDTVKVKTFYAVGECMNSRDFWTGPNIKQSDWFEITFIPDPDDTTIGDVYEWEELDEDSAYGLIASGLILLATLMFWSNHLIEFKQNH